MTEAIGGNTQAVTAFIARWQDSGAAEHANLQLVLSELCDLLGMALSIRRNPTNLTMPMCLSAASRSASPIVPRARADDEGLSSFQFPSELTDFGGKCYD